MKMKAYHDYLATHCGIRKTIAYYYVNWLNIYSGFCMSNKLDIYDMNSLHTYKLNLASDYEPWRVEQAERAVKLYWYWEKVYSKSGELNIDEDDQNQKYNLYLNEIVKIMKMQQKSDTTISTYYSWVTRYLCFCKDKELNKASMENFLTYLVFEKRIGASTQKQAFCALLFFFKHIIKLNLAGEFKNLRPKLKKQTYQR